MEIDYGYSGTIFKSKFSRNITIQVVVLKTG
ncbi:MAG: hypothetical protein HEEMFOPI_01547 [Holosporales bacterium]